VGRLCFKKFCDTNRSAVTAFAATSAARLALTMVAHEVGPAWRSNQSAVVKQCNDQFAGRQRGGGSINGANLAGGIGGFGFGLGDGRGELGLCEAHGVSSLFSTDRQNIAGYIFSVSIKM